MTNKERGELLSKDPIIKYGSILVTALFVFMLLFTAYAIIQDIKLQNARQAIGQGAGTK